MVFFFQAEDGIRDGHVTGVQTCALPISERRTRRRPARISPDGASVRTGPAAAGSAAWHATSDAAADHSLLHLGDRLGHLDAARACLGAVEGGAAAPHALLGVEDLQTLLAGIIARIEDEAKIG